MQSRGPAHQFPPPLDDSVDERPADLDDVERIHCSQAVAPGLDRRRQAFQDGGHGLALGAGHHPLEAPPTGPRAVPGVRDEVEQRQPSEDLGLRAHRAGGVRASDAGTRPGSGPTATGNPARLQSLYEPG